LKPQSRNDLAGRGSCFFGRVHRCGPRLACHSCLTAISEDLTAGRRNADTWVQVAGTQTTSREISMSHSHLISPAAFLVCFILIAPTASAQRCVKGIPCGNTCISATKTCRVGSGSATSAREPETKRPTTKQADSAMAATYLSITSRSTKSSTASPNDTLFVGSRVDGVFFLRTCLAAQDLAMENRRYFKTEKDAAEAKYRRSRVPGC